MITAEVWQAVALSFGAEPMTVRGLALDCRDGEFDESPPDFQDRLEIACNHIENGTLWAEGAGQFPFRKVALAEFSELALARNWCLPKQFPRNPGRTATPARTAVVQADPSGAGSARKIERSRSNHESERRQAGPSSTKTKIQDAAKVLIDAGKIPARTIGWKEFCKEIREANGVRSEHHGYSEDTIQNAVRSLLPQRDAGSTESTEN